MTEFTLLQAQTTRLWLGNVPPEASNEELVDLVKKYCKGHETRIVWREDKGASRPECIVAITGLAVGELDNVVRRLDGMYWKQRALSAYHPVFSEDYREHSTKNGW